MNSITDIFKVLSDDSRLRIIMLLFSESLCVCQLCEILGLSQPMVSKGLCKLRDVGLVINNRKEKFVFYSLTNNSNIANYTIQYLATNISEYPNLLNDNERLKIKDKLINYTKPSVTK